jgi:hypothetical protein
LSLPTSASAGRPESRTCLVTRTHTDAVEAPRARLELALVDMCHEAGVLLRTNPHACERKLNQTPSLRHHLWPCCSSISSKTFHP